MNNILVIIDNLQSKSHNLSIQIFFFSSNQKPLIMTIYLTKAFLLQVCNIEYQISDQIISIISVIDKSLTYNKQPHR